MASALAGSSRRKKWCEVMQSAECLVISHKPSTRNASLREEAAAERPKPNNHYWDL